MNSSKGAIALPPSVPAPQPANCQRQAANAELQIPNCDRLEILSRISPVNLICLANLANLISKWQVAQVFSACLAIAAIAACIPGRRISGDRQI